MLVILSAFLSLFYAPNADLSDTTRLVGVNKGMTLFIQNPYDKVNQQFCIESISVNKRKIDFNPKMSAVKVSFTDLELYVPVSVQVIHSDGCKPIFINPEAIFYHSNFNFEVLSISDSLLSWSTTGEEDGAVYVVEKLEGGLWRVENEINAKNQFAGASYTEYPRFEEGSNKFRIKYLMRSGKYFYSRELDFHYHPEPITFKPYKVVDKMTFSRMSPFKIYDAGGKLVMEGNAHEADLSSLPHGDYVIYFDGKDPGAFLKLQ